jgi:glutathione peroxidase
MKKIILVFLSAFLTSIFCFAVKQGSFYDFKMKTIDGKEFDFAQLKGKKVLIVNTASMCGNTPQYTELEKLYKKYGGDKFVILGFPANNFGAQEPGSNKEIMEFCKKSYGVSFPIFEKISVKGDDIAPLYRWLTEKEQNGVQDAPVKWNFQKFLIDKNGKWSGVVAPKTSPESEEIINFITEKQ